MKNLLPAIVILLGTVPALAQEMAPRRIAIAIDRTISFAGDGGAQVTQAEEQVTRFIRGLGADGRSLRRWEEDSDRVSLVAIDAAPEILLTTGLRSLQQAAGSWRQRFASREAYARCTDVVGAVQQALRAFEGATPTTRRYLYLYSDLVNEPARGSSLRRCQHPVQGPPEGFPWEALQGVEVSAFGVPPAAKRRWIAAAEAHGLRDSFHVYDPSEWTAFELHVPRRAAAPIDPEAQRQRREEVLGKGRSALLVGDVVAVLGIFALTAIAVMARLLRGRPRAARRPHTQRTAPRPARAA